MRSLADGGNHTYRLALSEGDALNILVHQEGIDLSISLYDPSGREIRFVDGPNGPEGPEVLAFVVARGGEHRLDVAAPSKAAKGRYRLQVGTLGPATAADRARAAALDLLDAGKIEFRQQTAEANRSAALLFREAITKSREAGEPLLEARSSRRLGLALLALGEIRKALEYLQDALDLLRLHSNGWELVPALNDLGEANRLASQPVVARARFEEAIKIGRLLPNPRAVAVALNNLGVIHASVGEIQEALTVYKKALSEWQRLGLKFRQATVLHNLGVLYVTLGRTEEGLDFLEAAFDLRLQLNDRDGQAVTLAAIGWTRGLNDDLAAGLAAFDQALDLRQELGDLRGEAVTLDQRGTVYLKMGRCEDAYHSYQRALKLAAGDRLSDARTMTNLGAVHIAMGQPEKAIEGLHRALILFRKVGDLQGEAAALATIAQAERQLGRLASARLHLEAALGIIESVRSRLQSHWLRTSYLAVRHKDYGAYIDLLMSLEVAEPGQGHAARAFEASERARARGLLDSLAEAQAGVRRTVAPQLLEQERTLRARINALENQRIALAATGEEAAKNLEKRVRELLLEYESLQGEIRSRAPAFTDPRPLRLKEIQENVLGEDAIILAYSLGDERSFLWVIERNYVESYRLPPRAEIESLAGRVHGLLSRSHVPGYREQTLTALQSLSTAILKPAAANFGKKILLIVGDGALHYVPFSALPVRGTLADEWGPEPLLAENQIVQLPSVSVLAQLRREASSRRPAPRLLAVVADPVFQVTDPRMGLNAVSDMSTSSQPKAGTDLLRAFRDFGGRFERLPYAGVEAEVILSFSSEADRFHALGFEATRELVLSGHLESYRIIHFATHGLLDARHPTLSGVVLTLVDREGRPQEGLLRVHEIYDLRLAADLVVLSACRTALGQEIRGEGLVGLAHGFFYAGASSLVVSLWNVNDRATADLMGLFYHGMLRDGLRPAEALRTAQLSMRSRSDWKAPYYWAGFTLQGEWR